MSERICLRCGGPLPEVCSPSRKYCDACAAERNRELTRERLERARQRAYILRQQKQESKDRAYCKKCVFYGSESYGGNLCDYMLRTGHRRGCRYGQGCKKREIVKQEEADGN